MRCTSCELVLAEYLEGTLDRRHYAAVNAHLQSCTACRSIYDELRHIDGLLVTAREVETAPNFTFALMAEVRSMPVPHRPRPVWPWFVVAFWAVSWAAIIAWVTTTRPAVIVSLAGTLWHKVSGVATATTAATHVFVHAPGPTLLFVGGAMALDAMLAAVVVFIFAAVRPRIVAALHHSEVA